MPGPEFEDFGITKEQFDSICARNKRIRNYTFGISSAVGILAGCVYGVSIANGAYETVLFILFFGCFLGSLFGGIFTLAVVSLNSLILYSFSPAYRHTEGADSTSGHGPTPRHARRKSPVTESRRVFPLPTLCLDALFTIFNG